MPRLTNSEKTINVLSIDAWRDGSGWTWNAWYKVDSFPLHMVDAWYAHPKRSPRKIFRELREMGLLGEGSKGRVMLDDDGFNLVVVDKGTREPIFAIEYGAAEDDTHATDPNPVPHDVIEASDFHHEREAIACHTPGCYLAVDASGRCEVHGLPKGEV